jgi:hypothetical protein
MTAANDAGGGEARGKKNASKKKPRNGETPGPKPSRSTGDAAVVAALVRDTLARIVASGAPVAEPRRAAANEPPP